MSTTHVGETLSLWQSDIEFPSLRPLKQDLCVDVCIIGGGIAGLLSAYLLMKEGKKVCILESYELFGGQTSKTSGHVTKVLDRHYKRIEKIHGTHGALLAAESHEAAMNIFEEIVRDEKIDCDLERVPGLLYATTEKDILFLKAEYESLQRTGHFHDVQWSEDPIGLTFPNQLQLHPLKFLNSLSKILIQNGVKIHTHSHVTDIQSSNGLVVKTTRRQKVYCKSIVVATHVPINDMFVIHTKQAAYRSYVVGFKIPKNSIKKGLYWDTLEPFHYARVQASDDHDILIVGGEDHKTGQLKTNRWCFEDLEQWTFHHYGSQFPVLYRWSGQIMETMDGLGYLGHNPWDNQNVYIITGDSGNGLTHAAIGAMIITDQIMNRENPWEKLYSPSRLSLKASAGYLKENVNVAAQYADWIQPSAKPNLKNLKPEEGVVFREGIKIVAAYKNRHGNIELMSAACPHLAGVVSWNSVEKSWDCPCHGSRFDCHGHVIEGPARTHMKKLGTEFLERGFTKELQP